MQKIVTTGLNGCVHARFLHGFCVVFQYEFTASFLEIYNETIRDLLDASSKEGCKHDIKMVAGRKNEVYVSNLTNVTVTSKEQVRCAGS